MRKYYIGILLVILATSYIVQREQILKRIYAMRDRPSVQAVITEKPKAKKPEQQVEILAYPAPGDQPVSPYPYIPPTEWQPTIITPDLGPPPTPAPTYNSWGD